MGFQCGVQRGGIFQVAAQSFANNSAKNRKKKEKGISDFLCCAFFLQRIESFEWGRKRKEWETPVHRFFILSEIEIKNIVHFWEFVYRIR